MELSLVLQSTKTPFIITIFGQFSNNKEQKGNKSIYTNFVAPIAQAESEKKNKRNGWEIQHVIVLWQSMQFHPPHVWIIFAKCKAQILCETP